MSERPIARLGSLHDIERFRDVLRELGLRIPCDTELKTGASSPLAQPIEREGIRIGNRFAIHPMEGWDGTLDGRPTESTLRRWRRFGASGAKLIWGGEAVAVRPDGRANPNQLVINAGTLRGLDELRRALIAEHRRAAGSAEGLVVGLQLTHSGRYSVPESRDRPEPKILYHHPVLDRRMRLPENSPVLTDEEVAGIIEDFVRAAKRAQDLGFDFVDVKHCHGYLGHEFLSAHTRAGRYGGSFENRTRFLREVVGGIRAEAPGLRIGVRLSAFDMVPFQPDPATSKAGRPGVGVPVPHAHLIPYQYGFGVNPLKPTEPDLNEPLLFLALLEELGIHLVNVSAGSPYYNPHIQRPALFPPSDGYQPPEDPLVGVARQMEVARQLKEAFPRLVIVGTAYSYLQDFLPNVAQAAVRENWVDVVGFGRMVLAYPEILRDALEGRSLDRKRVCRTFSDCTTAPRNGLPSGCYPLDAYYRDSEAAARLKKVKEARKAETEATSSRKPAAGWPT